MEQGEPVLPAVAPEDEVLIESWKAADKEGWARDFGFVSYVLGTQLFSQEYTKVTGQTQTGNSEDAGLFTNLYLGKSLEESMGIPGAEDAYNHHIGNTALTFTIRRAEKDTREKAADSGTANKYQPAADATAKADVLLNEAALNDEDNLERGIDHEYHRMLALISSPEKEQRVGKERRGQAEEARTSAKEKMVKLRDQRKQSIKNN